MVTKQVVIATQPQWPVRLYTDEGFWAGRRSKFVCVRAALLAVAKILFRTPKGLFAGFLGAKAPRDAAKLDEPMKSSPAPPRQCAAAQVRHPPGAGRYPGAVCASTISIEMIGQAAIPVIKANKAASAT